MHTETEVATWLRAFLHLIFADVEFDEGGTDVIISDAPVFVRVAAVRNEEPYRSYTGLSSEVVVEVTSALVVGLELWVAEDLLDQIHYSFEGGRLAIEQSPIDPTRVDLVFKAFLPAEVSQCGRLVLVTKEMITASHQLLEALF